MENYDYYKSFVGEKVFVDGEADTGIVTRIDAERGIIYILFKKMREEMYPFPENVDLGKIKIVETKKK
ncbi:MAG: hypothetical protein LBV58_04920 [Acholeplasmatales bacterium]|jgi:hypothetical protein|nr:hypothetical protein [Acholeplasmatales bacterium]